jgi:glucan biosynthesis protein
MRTVWLCALALSLGLGSPRIDAAESELTADLLGELVLEAFARSKEPFDPMIPEQAPAFDAPQGGSGLGLDFVEYEELRGSNFFDDGVWWLRPTPRGNFEKDTLEVWMYRPELGEYEPIVYQEQDFDYRHPLIQPALPYPVPESARYLSALDVGRRLVNLDSWPQLLHIGGNGYGRLTGFHPLVFGTSFRLGLRNVGEPNEDFAKLRKIHIRRVSDDIIQWWGLIDSEAFAAALAAELQPGYASTLQVDMWVFLRLPLRVAEEPSLGPLGLSSMFWKDEHATPDNPYDEAHDADLFVVDYPGGRQVQRRIVIPQRPSDPPLLEDFGRASGFALVQTDRVARHYRLYESADYADRVSIRVSDIRSSLPYTVGLLETYTNYEGADNIAVFVRFDADRDVPDTVRDGITFSYRLTAYGEPSSQPARLLADLR